METHILDKSLDAQLNAWSFTAYRFGGRIRRWKRCIPSGAAMVTHGVAT
jgi:hypothetical protein